MAGPLPPMATLAPYRYLGVEPVINCGASRSFYGNSVIESDLAEAMRQAGNDFVIMRELADAVGARLAALTSTPWFLISTGTTGMADTVLMPAGHRFAYDQGMRLTGCKIEGNPPANPAPRAWRAWPEGPRVRHASA